MVKVNSTVVFHKPNSVRILLEFLETYRGRPVKRNFIADKIGLPRTTVYDILKSLEREKIVDRPPPPPRKVRGRSPTLWELRSEVTLPEAFAILEITPF